MSMANKPLYAGWRKKVAEPIIKRLQNSRKCIKYICKVKFNVLLNSLGDHSHKT